MDKLKYIKIEKADGSLSDSIPLTADAVNITMANGNSAENEINSKVNKEELNTVKSGLQNEINSLASGSPKGVYATISALKSANPNTGVYIVQSNGHIYSWTKNQSEDPIDLGVYQSTSIDINDPVIAGIIKDNVGYKGTVIEGDCNLTKENGVYQVNKTHLNIPSGMEQNGILVVFYGGNTLTRITQLLFEYSEANLKNFNVWVRFTTKSVDSTTTFTKWKKIMLEDKATDLLASALSTKDVKDITDLNNLMVTGIYYFGSATSGVLNKPSNIILLLVMTNGTRGIQYAFDYYSNKMWHRQTKDIGATWTDWIQIFDTENIIGYLTAGDGAKTLEDSYIENFNSHFDGKYSLVKNNLFNGEYISGLSIASGRTDWLIKEMSTSSFNSTVILPVKPNTQYSVLVEDKGPEEDTGYYYFKGVEIATDTPTKQGVIGININTENANGLFFETYNYVKVRKFITKSTTTHIVIQASKTKQPFLQVIEGNYNDFTTDTYDNSTILIDNTKSDEDKISIEYKDDKNYTINFGKYNMRLFRTISESADQDNWNIGDIRYLDNIVVPSGTDIIGPIKVSGDNDFLSGVHGSSTTTVLKVYCDGIPVTLNSDLLQKCDKITIQMIDECRRESNKVHVFDRYVTLEITKNKIHILNAFKCVSDTDLLVERATNGGLIAVRNSILTGASMNNYILTEAPTHTISNGSRKNIHAVINHTMGDIVVNNIQGKENDTYNGRFTVFVNENPIRTKTYFDIMTKETVTKDQMITGEFEYIFS